MLFSNSKKYFLIKWVSTLLIFYSLLLSTVTAKVISAKSLQNNSVQASFDIRAWQSKFDFANERQRFIKTDVINIKATIYPDSDDIGQNTTIHILALVGKQAFMQDSNGLWHPFTGELLVFENRVLAELEEVLIISNLSNLPIVADIFVGYSTKSGDIIFNGEAYNVRIDKSYSKVLTVGENGSFKGCNGMQFALNLVQDWEEIRIEKGLYKCTGLELPEAKEFAGGIRISGGWDSTFTNQSNDPSLTQFDGGALVIDDDDDSIIDLASCGEKSGFWDRGICYQEAPPTERILRLNSGFVSINTLSFQNAFSLGNGGAIQSNPLKFFSSENASSIDNCVFTQNRAANGGAVYLISFISNSSFNKNVAIRDNRYANSKGFGGAVNSSISISNSTFTHNMALGSTSTGGALYDITMVSGNTFIDNRSDMDGGAVGRSTTLINNTFTKNTAERFGGAVASVDTISYSIFRENIAFSSGGAISHTGKIFSNEFNGNSSKVDGGAVYASNKIANCSFVDNRSESQGGAIALILSNTFTSTSASIVNNLFVNNHAINGGAISEASNVFSFHPKASVFNNTFVKNSATESGGAIYGTGEVLNSVFSENTAAGKNNDIHSTGSTGDFILDYSLFDTVTGTVDIRPNFIIDNPLFVDANNGNYHLQADSPAINAGDNTRSSDDYALILNELGVDSLIDLDNAQRIQAGRIDMGAYEFQ